MKNLVLSLLLIIFLVSASHATRVGGYFKSSGKYVAPHYRASSDTYKFNNYSTKGNVNPYTGKAGYKSILKY